MKVFKAQESVIVIEQESMAKVIQEPGHNVCFGMLTIFELKFLIVLHSQLRENVCFLSWWLPYFFALYFVWCEDSGEYVILEEIMR